MYAEYRMVKINLADIRYIESLEDYIRIHVANGKPVMTLMPLKKVLEKLPPDKFKRIHRSYIVSVSQVKSILNRKVQLTSGKELPISDSYSSFISEWKNGQYSWFPGLTWPAFYSTKTKLLLLTWFYWLYHVSRYPI